MDDKSEGLLGRKKLMLINKNRGVSRYFVTTISMNFFACLLVIFNTEFTLCLGGMAILFLLELHLCKYIF